MYVRSGGATGRADHGHGLAALDGVADGHECLCVMGIARAVAIAVIDLDQITVAFARSSPGQDPGGDGQHISARVGRKIHALVHGFFAIERVHALAEIG